MQLLTECLIVAHKKGNSRQKEQHRNQHKHKYIFQRFMAMFFSVLILQSSGFWLCILEYQRVFYISVVYGQACCRICVFSIFQWFMAIHTGVSVCFLYSSGLWLFILVYLCVFCILVVFGYAYWTIFQQFKAVHIYRSISVYSSGVRPCILVYQCFRYSSGVWPCILVYQCFLYSSDVQPCILHWCINVFDIPVVYGHVQWCISVFYFPVVYGHAYLCIGVFSVFQRVMTMHIGV